MNEQIWQEINSIIQYQRGNRPVTIAIVGAGGKSTTMMVLVKRAVFEGYRSIATTTTHIGSGSAVRIKTQDGENGHALLRVFGEEGSHFTGPSCEAEWAQILDNDVVFVEADGAKRMSFKVPLSHEPVYPEATDCVIVIFAADVIGLPLEKVCFRSERALEILEQEGVSDCDMLTEQSAAILLVRGYIEDARLPEGVPFIVIANRCYGKEITRRAERVQLEAQRILTGSNRRVLWVRNVYTEEELLQKPEGM